MPDAKAAQAHLINCDLQTIIDHWPALPDAIKAGIIAMVRAVKNSEKLA